MIQAGSGSYPPSLATSYCPLTIASTLCPPRGSMLLDIPGLAGSLQPSHAHSGSLVCKIRANVNATWIPIVFPMYSIRLMVHSRISGVQTVTLPARNSGQRRKYPPDASWCVGSEVIGLVIGSSQSMLKSKSAEQNTFGTCVDVVICAYKGATWPVCCGTLARMSSRMLRSASVDDCSCTVCSGAIKMGGEESMPLRRCSRMTSFRMIRHTRRLFQS